MSWPVTRDTERQARRSREMMDRLGVDRGKLARLREGEAYSEARANCLRCADARECLLWLDGRPHPCDTPHFCPNLALFESCKKT